MAARKLRRNILCSGPAKATDAAGTSGWNGSALRLIARRDIGPKHFADQV